MDTGKQDWSSMEVGEETTCMFGFSFQKHRKSRLLKTSLTPNPPCSDPKILPLLISRDLNVSCNTLLTHWLAVEEEGTKGEKRQGQILAKHDLYINEKKVH